MEKCICSLHSFFLFFFRYEWLYQHRALLSFRLPAFLYVKSVAPIILNKYEMSIRRQQHSFQREHIHYNIPNQWYMLLSCSRFIIPCAFLCVWIKYIRLSSSADDGLWKVNHDHFQNKHHFWPNVVYLYSTHTEPIGIKS